MREKEDEPRMKDRGDLLAFEEFSLEVCCACSPFVN